jgi:transcriptional regulator with XRE-family HTH domain/tetratricopeptide (TPR) repeat protein
VTTTFAVALRTARHDAGLTLEELSESSSVSVRALSDMERGRALGPQRRTVELIADALKLDGGHREAFLALAKAGRTRSTSFPTAPGLCELPGPIGDFTGRSAELAWLSRFSSAAVVSGGAGLGKTTLVVRAAHSLRDQFPGGVHFVAALGMSGRPVGSDEILARVLRALGVREAQIPQDPHERSAKYRHLLREQPALVIVDDVAAETQVRPLLPGEGGSRLLVTSRRLLAGLEGVQRLHLDPMPAVDAYDLLSRIVAERGDQSPAGDLQDLADLLGGLPLALRIAGNRLVSRPQWTVTDLVGRLSDSHRRLEQLSAGDLTVAAAFDVSYQQLPGPTRQVFRRAAVAQSADFSATLAAITSDVSVNDAEDHLDDLVDLGLVEIAAGARYRFHDLVRLYAYHRLEQDEPPAAVTAARGRMVSWLLSTLATAGQWFEPDGERAIFASARDAEAWIRMEAEHWLPALGAAAIAGDHHSVVAAAGSLHWFSDNWNHWPRWLGVYTIGLDSAIALGDRRKQAEFLNLIAWTYTQPLRDYPVAVQHAMRALELARSSGDALQEAWAWQYTAFAYLQMGDLPAARHAAHATTKAAERARDPDAVCQAILAEADIGNRLGETADALDGFQRALAMVEDTTSGMTSAVATATLPRVLALTAQALGRTGRPAEGIPLALRAVQLWEQTQVDGPLAMILRVLGEDLYGPQQQAEARQCLQRAAALYASVGWHDHAARCREAAAAKADDGRS